MKNSLIGALLFIGLFILGTSELAGAKENRLIQFQIEESKGPNLLRETRALHLLDEPSVQAEAKPRSRSYSFYFGELRGQNFTVQSASRPVRYDLNQSLISFGFGYTQYPFFWKGQWGWQASFSYASTNGAVDRSLTKLHLFPSQVGLIYRGRAQAAQYWAPLFGLGLGNVVLVQRGSENLNTSESQFMGYAKAGVWWGFGEQLQKADRTPLDLSLFFQQLISPVTRDSNWNAGSVMLGLGLSI